MTDQNPTDSTPASPKPQTVTLDASQIAHVIAAGMAEAMRQYAPKKISIGQYDPKNPFHPDKRTPKPQLTRHCFQNGTRMDPISMFDEEINLLNSIVRPGRYINRLVEVIIRDEGGDRTLELRYKNRTADQRFENVKQFRDLVEMLRKVVMEQAEALTADVPKRAAAAERQRVQLQQQQG